MKRIAKKLGAKIVERLPDVGRGTVGAMKTAKLIEERLQRGKQSNQRERKVGEA